jgi:AcrR family transcriptional regulator
MQNSSRPDTKTALIRAAERLFAEKGLGAVSARDIMREAGARNQSALQYHFGGMEALIRQVFAERYREIEQTRRANLEELEAAGGSNSVEEIMNAAIAPWFESCLEENGRLFARFVVQVSTDPRFNMTALMGDLEMNSMNMLGEMLAACLAELPQDTLRTRLRQAFTVSVIQGADYARQVEWGTAPPVERAIREAAASLAGFLETMPS